MTKNKMLNFKYFLRQKRQLKENDVVYNYKISFSGFTDEYITNDYKFFKNIKDLSNKHYGILGGSIIDLINTYDITKSIKLTEWSFKIEDLRTGDEIFNLDDLELNEIELITKEPIFLFLSQRVGMDNTQIELLKKIIYNSNFNKKYNIIKKS